MIAVGIVYILKKRKSSTYSPNKHQEKSISILHKDGETKAHSSGTFFSNPLYDEIYSNESSFGSFRASGDNLEEEKIVDIVQE